MALSYTISRSHSPDENWSINPQEYGFIRLNIETKQFKLPLDIQSTLKWFRFPHQNEPSWDRTASQILDMAFSNLLRTEAAFSIGSSFLAPYRSASAAYAWTSCSCWGAAIYWSWGLLGLADIFNQTIFLRLALTSRFRCYSCYVLLSGLFYSYWLIVEATFYLLRCFTMPVPRPRQVLKDG